MPPAPGACRSSAIRVGMISMIDSGQQPVYRGEGCFPGWSQDELKANYLSMIPNEAVLELMQLG